MEMTLARLQQWFEEAEDSTSDARAKAERDRDYVDGKQLSAAEHAELSKRGQPAIVINKVRKKVSYLRGLQVQSRTDPKAFPRTPQHQQDAEAVTDSLRFVADNANLDVVLSAAYDNFLVEGLCACEVGVEETPDGKIEVALNRYAWDRIFVDPHSSELDCSDARYNGAVIWQDADTLAMDHPEDADKIAAAMAETTVGSETYDDRPHHAWIDAKRRRIRIVLMYWRDGKGAWNYTKFARNIVLDSGVSPYVDEHDQPVNPLIMATLYMDRDNNRYGMVRDMIDPQDEVNKRRSKFLHLLNSRQTIGEKGAVDSVTAMKRELSKPDGHVEVEPDMRFDFLPQNDFASGQATLYADAKTELDDLGANPALSGDTGESTSGRAVIARQQGGLIEIAAEADAFKQFKLTIYRHIWMRIRQYWTEERWIRVTDDEANVKFVTVNRPVTLSESLSGLDDESLAQAALEMGLRPNDPRLSMTVAVENQLAAIDVDIVIDEAPNQATLEGETFEQLVNLDAARGGVLPIELLVEMAPGLRRDVKDRVIEAMKAQQEAQQQAQAAAMAQQQPIAEAMAGAEIRATHAKASKDEADAMSKLPLAAYS